MFFGEKRKKIKSKKIITCLCHNSVCDQYPEYLFGGKESWEAGESETRI
jgi:hypothetical protein